jgi:hypothetical protein
MNDNLPSSRPRSSKIFGTNLEKEWTVPEDEVHDPGQIRTALRRTATTQKVGEATAF